MSHPATFALLLFVAFPALAADAPSLNYQGVLGGVALTSVAAMATWAVPLPVQEMVPADFEARPAPTADRSTTWRLTNRPQALEARFGTGGVLVGPHDRGGADWSWGLALVGFGPGGMAAAVLPAEPVAAGNRVEYRRPGLIEWYVNDARGVEQGFTLLAPPAGNRTQIELLLAISGSLSAAIAAGADGLVLRDAGGTTVLAYGELHAFDATGRTLPAWMDLAAAAAGGQSLRIAVDVADAVFPVVIDPLIATQVKKLTAADADIGDKFGASVSVDGDTAVVGAWRDGGINQALGAAYVFERNAGGANNWGQVKKLTPSDANLGDQFGVSVSISGDTIAVGNNFGGGNGRAHVFERNAGGANNWGEIKKLLAADGATNDKFGTWVSINGDVIVVGANGNDDAGESSGSAYLFERNSGGPGNWGEIKKLTAADAATGDRFGRRVAISGDTVAVGADGDDDLGSDSGSAYVFERHAGGTNNWGQVKKLKSPNGAAFRQFGISISLSGDTFVAQNAENFGFASAVLFERNAGGAANWGYAKKVTAADEASGDAFGSSVSIDGNRIVVGAHQDDDAGGSSGSAYVFERNAGGAENWGQVKKLTASDAASIDFFGRSVSIDGDTVVVGADEDDAAVLDSGSAYVFGLSSSPVCGDGIQETPESCDDGAGNSDVMPDACRTDCTLAGCGDGVTDTGEDCDDTGESASCDADCTLAVCGDGTWNVSLGEICDDGNTVGGDDCAADCSVADTGVPGGTSGGDMLVLAVGSQLEVSFAPACSATDHAAYWGHGPIGPGGLEWSGSACGLGTSGTASFDPGLLLPGELLYFVIVGYDGNDEGSYGVDSTLAPRPEAVGVGACDRPAGPPTCGN
jgi:cysteine-rich repeat protein